MMDNYCFTLISSLCLVAALAVGQKVLIALSLIALGYFWYDESQ